jgi:hypothetical protein
MKLFPLISTASPGLPLAGTMLVIVGAGGRGALAPKPGGSGSPSTNTA